MVSFRHLTLEEGMSQKVTLGGVNLLLRNYGRTTAVKEKSRISRF
jgi:hypothetical protein